MGNIQSILTSFKQQDDLNPKIWYLPKERYMGDHKGQSYKMNPKVRERLLQIAHEFINFLDVDIIVSDIIMTGSLANYNWSKYSDIDLHILTDFGQFSKKELPLYEELFRLKKTIYNDKHDIKIYGYEVELYVQDESESHFSSGVYSVLKNEWLVKPKKENPKIDKKLITSKVNQWMDIIDGVIENVKDEPIDVATELLKKYKDKLKKYRTCGLEKGGEYSDENIVFKILRRNGYIEKLYNFQNKHVDKLLSLNEITTNIGGNFKTDLENGPKNHGGRALGNWQSDNAWDVFAPAGTIVNSYTNGTVTKIRDTGKNSGKIFGTQVSIQGVDGYPNIFYTHLKNVSLKPGDTVKVGDYIGEISEWIGHDSMTHVHIGLPYGRHLRELLGKSDKMFSGDKGDSVINKQDNTSTDTSTDKDSEEIDNLVNKSLSGLNTKVKDSGHFLDALNISDDDYLKMVKSALQPLIGK